MNKEAYTQYYNHLTERMGTSGTGSDDFLFPIEILTECGYIHGMSVLDYGCGWGSLLKVIQPESYMGVDISPFIIEKARDAFKDYIFDVSTIGSLNENLFDVVISHSVFTHIPKGILNECLEDIKRNLKQDGFAIIDIWYGDQQDDLFTTYEHNEWLTQLSNHGLSGTLVGEKERPNGFSKHYYYKITWQI